jgi:ribulose-phosphate 3-epimerase
MHEIIPAILTNDISDFKLKHSNLIALGNYFHKLHIDFIDGEFIPGKTIMPKDLKFLKTDFLLMAHLMTFDPSKYFTDLKDVGFSWVVIHYEAFKRDEDILQTIKEAKSLELKIGLAINPETPLHKTAKILQNVDLVQIMGVHPGAQGRTFETGSIEKIKELRNLTRDMMISVDGGVKLGIASKCAAAGADMIIIGSGILHSTHPKEALESFKRELELA